MSKMLTDGLQAPREKMGRKNQKTMWLFLKRPFKYPVGAVLSTFWDCPGFGVAQRGGTQTNTCDQNGVKGKEPHYKNESLKEDLEFLKNMLFFFFF